MAARWKTLNKSRYHEQMLVRAAFVAYGEVYGAEAAARKFNVSLPCYYYWLNKFFNQDIGDSNTAPLYDGVRELISIKRDFTNYVIFEN